MSYDWDDVDDSDAEDIALGLSSVVRDSVRNLPPEIIEQRFLGTLSRLSPSEAESFLSGLKDIGGKVGGFVTSKQFRNVVATAAPIAGGVAGTFIGGPMGTALGASLGGMAGKMVSGQRPGAAAAGAIPQVASALGGSFGIPGLGGAPQMGAPAMPGMPSMAMPAMPALSGAPAFGGSPAAAQLLNVIQNPALTSSLLSLVMGSNGQQAIPVGGTQVPPAALMNLVATLAGRAQDDADALLAAEEEAVPDYLLDKDGCLSCDPAVSSQRADALLRRMTADAEAELALDAELQYGDDGDAELDDWDEGDEWDDWDASDWE